LPKKKKKNKGKEFAPAKFRSVAEALTFSKKGETLVSPKRKRRFENVKSRQTPPIRRGRRKKNPRWRRKNAMPNNASNTFSARPKGGVFFQRREGNRGENSGGGRETFPWEEGKIDRQKGSGVEVTARAGRKVQKKVQGGRPGK